MSRRVGLQSVVLLFLVAWFPLVAWAAEDLIDGELPPLVEEVVVSATRTPAPADSLGSSVTVLGSEEIAARNKNSVLELLRTIPGLEVNQQGGPGRAAAVFLRGAGAAGTLVLIDGVPVNSPNVGNYDFADLRADQIERIEVLRGPQSSLYGSEAMGGVINIVTRRGLAGESLTAGFERGNRQTSRFRLGFGGASEHRDFRFTCSRDDVKGVSAASERNGNTEKDPFRNSSLAGLAGWKWGEAGRIEAAFHYLNSKAALDSFAFGIGPVDDPNWEQARKTGMVSIKAERKLSPIWRQSARLSYFKEKIDGTDPDTLWNNFQIRSQVLDFSAQADIRPASTHLLTLGAGYQKRKGENVGNFDEGASLSSAFVQDQWSWKGKLFLTGAVRFDRHSVAGSKATGRATVAWRVDDAVRLHGSYGTGFRAPTFNELYFPFYGNPKLEPETSTGYDAGVALNLLGGKGTVDLTYFQNRFENLIAYDFAAFQAMNIDRAQTHGFEASFGFRPGDAVQVEGSYTLTVSEDLKTGLMLPRRPRHRGAVSLFINPLENLNGSVTLVAVHDRIDSDGRKLDDYTRIDLGLKCRLMKGVDGALRIENLLDRDFEEIRGYTSPGRMATLGLDLSF